MVKSTSGQFSEVFGRDFEGLVFAAIVSRAELLSSLADLMDPRWFSNHLHQHVVEVLLKLYQEYRVFPSRETVQQQLLEEHRRQGWEQETFREVLMELGRGYHRGTQLDETAVVRDKVERFARQQSFSVGILEAARLVQEHKQGRLEAMDEAIRVMRTSMSVGVTQPSFDVCDFLNRPSELFDADVLSSPRFRVPVGIPRIDHHLEGGPGAGEVLLFLGEPNIGKSMALVSVAASAVRAGKRVAYISTEMKPAQFGIRLLANLTQTGMDEVTINSKNYQKEADKFLLAYPGRQCKATYWPPGVATVANIRAWMSILNDRDSFTPEVIVIDYLDELRAGSLFVKKGTDGAHTEDTFSAQGDIMADLIALGVDHTCPIVSATQTNREGFGRDPQTKHTGRSVAKVERADFVVGLCQNTVEASSQEMRYSMLKVRRGVGKNDHIPLTTDFARATIRQRVEQPQEAVVQ
jgi:replicative DNA helicase